MITGPRHQRGPVGFAIEPGEDFSAGEMLCRLAALAFEQFEEDDVLDLLTEYAAHEPSSSQAAYELGLVHIGRALMCGSLSDIADGFDVARTWLETGGSFMSPASFQTG